MGDTDSERFFNALMAMFDPGDVIASPRRIVEAFQIAAASLRSTSCSATATPVRRGQASARSNCSGSRANLDLDADTRTHYHVHLERSARHVVLVSSEKLTESEPWVSSTRTSY